MMTREQKIEALYHSVHAHCLKCTYKEDGKGAIDKMFEHVAETGHKWTFDYKRPLD